jgi:hypothetical protein
VTEQQQLAMQQQQLLLLGEIKGIVQGLQAGQQATNARLDKLEARIDERMDGIDTRLRHVEQRAAIFGAASGGAMAIGTALIIEGLKAWFTRGGSAP